MGPSSPYAMPARLLSFGQYGAPFFWGQCKKKMGCALPHRQKHPIKAALPQGKRPMRARIGKANSGAT